MTTDRLLTTLPPSLLSFSFCLPFPPSSLLLLPPLLYSSYSSIPGHFHSLSCHLSSLYSFYILANFLHVLLIGLLPFYPPLRESSFNMTRGDGDIEGEGGLQKFLDTRKGAMKKIRGGGLRKFVYFKTNRRGELLKNWTATEGGC